MPDRIIEPASTCSICGHGFVQGDKAICIVKVPDGEADTLCVADWTVMLAASAVTLRDMPYLDWKGIKTLLDEAQASFADLDDP